VALFVSLLAAADTSDSDPYVMNGCLLAAVAGRDFAVLATDTRMMGNHVSSRLWAATPAQTVTTTDLVAPDGSLAVDIGPELDETRAPMKTLVCDYWNKVRMMVSLPFGLDP
jgi:hypothetical protein